MNIENSLEDELHKDCSHCKFLKDVGITLLDAKWLDPACHKGCSSLFLKERIENLKDLIGKLNHRIHSGYDWNADPDNMTLLVGEVLLDDEDDSCNVVVTLLDTMTGDIRVVEGIREFDWIENNYSCDCNRSIFFDNWDESNTCDSVRYIVIDVYPNLSNYTMEEFNENYPEYLLKKCMNIE